MRSRGDGEGRDGTLQCELWLKATHRLESNLAQQSRQTDICC